MIYDPRGREGARGKGADGSPVCGGWCPDRQADLTDINAERQPAKDITIVVVDYDKERELEKTYAVTVQHTFVQIDGKGVKLACGTAAASTGSWRTHARVGTA